MISYSELTDDIQDRLNKLPVPRDILIRIIAIVKDAWDEGFKEGEEWGIQKVLDDPAEYADYFKGD